MSGFTVKIRPLTPIWTGDANRKNTVLRETGIIGSLRWWYEALIRGLGGDACDPTNSNCDGKNHCVACELFGCTGWARKFRLEVEEIKSDATNEEILFKFIPLRKIDDREWALLNLTLNIIANYGAIGGRTTLKPTDEPGSQNKPYHKDFGLIEIVSSELDRFSFELEELKNYVKDEKWRKVDQSNFKWVSIQNFWCVNGKYLSRKSANESSFNKVLGRKEQKKWASQTPSDNISKWLSGSQRESKKVFSFKNPPRTFGFVNPDIVNFEQIKERLKSVWGEGNDWQLLTGNDILNDLLEGLR